jgi:hypothetical protein
MASKVKVWGAQLPIRLPLFLSDRLDKLESSAVKGKDSAD